MLTQNCLVIGASRGIGAAVASRFLEEGFTVAGTHRGSGVPDGVFGVTADVRDQSQLLAGIKNSIDFFGGPIDVMVYNAGTVDQNLVMRMPQDALYEALETNLIGAFTALRGVLPSMLRQRSGSIVLVSSESARVGIPGAAHYTASKAGLEGLMRSLMWEVGPRGIRVNTVAPGATETDMLRQVTEENLAKLIERTPLGRIATSREMAEAIFYVSQIPHMTGAVVPVTGGEGLGV